jgi:hypothetical protein
MYTKKFVLGLLRFAGKTETLLELYESKKSIKDFPAYKLKQTICKAY